MRKTYLCPLVAVFCATLFTCLPLQSAVTRAKVIHFGPRPAAVGKNPVIHFGPSPSGNHIQVGSGSNAVSIHPLALMVMRCPNHSAH